MKKINNNMTKKRTVKDAKLNVKSDIQKHKIMEKKVNQPVSSLNMKSVNMHGSCKYCFAWMV